MQALPQRPALLLTALFAVGCGGGGPALPCSGVQCPPGQFCVASTGVCTTMGGPGDGAPAVDLAVVVAGDGGRDLAAADGPGADGGRADAGLDLGAVDLAVADAAVDLGRGDLGASADLARGDGPGASDTCAGAEPLALVNNQVSFTVDTGNLKDDSLGGCGGAGPDAVYQLTLGSAAKINVTVTPDVASPSYRPVVYLRREALTGCAGPGEIDCRLAAAAGLAVTVATIAQPAGRYYLWIDGTSLSKGRSKVVVSLEPTPPPSNETCASAQALTVGVPAHGDTTTARHDLGSRISLLCDLDLSGALPGPDLVYAFTAAQAGSVKVTLAPGPKYDAALWLMAGSCVADGSTCTQISDNIGLGRNETLTIAAAAGRTYYLVVDGYDATELGPFTLTLQ